VHRWAALTASEAREVARRDPVAVLPLAAVEQHGPHLPLSTDVDIGAGILAGALEAADPHVDVVVLPGEALGASLEHGHLPGTLDRGAAALEDAVVRTGHALARMGVRRLLIHNSHGGNKAVVDAAALRLRREAGLLVVKAHWFRFPRPDDVALPAAEWEHGLHGGAVETAMMLHLHPDRVRMEALQSFESLGGRLEEELTWVRPEGVAPFAWLADDLHPAGVAGDASLATPELGARLVAHFAGVLAEILADTAAFDLSSLVAVEPGLEELLAPLAGAGEWVVGQLGQSLDGRIATASGHSHYINGPGDIRRLHAVRALADAVIVGAGTVAADDCRLTVRQVPGRNPVRVVLDPSARLSRDRAVFTDGAAPTLWVVGEGAVSEGAGAGAATSRDGGAEVDPRGGHGDGAHGVEMVPLREEGEAGFAPAAVLEALHRRGLRRVLVEGGGITVSRFLAAGALDRLHVSVAPLVIGSGRPGITLPEVATLDEALRPPVRHVRLGTDLVFDLELSPRDA
jgi:creatinine amidohydrolase